MACDGIIEAQRKRDSKEAIAPQAHSEAVIDFTFPGLIEGRDPSENGLEDTIGNLGNYDSLVRR